MTKIFNIPRDKEKRRSLRKNMTRAEVLLWVHLRNRRMLGCRFLRQYGVDSYMLDFYCPSLKLAIEVDGDSHFKEEAQDYDRERQDFIESLGISFLRFLNTDIYNNMDAVLVRIAEKVKALSTQSKREEQ